MIGNNDVDMLVLIDANEGMGQEIVRLRAEVEDLRIKLNAAETERDAANFTRRALEDMRDY